jgi:FixJ family two-component response regulator
MSYTEPTVFVLNGDPGTRGGLCELVGSRYLHVVPCGSAGEYLRFPKPDAPGCVIADIDLPDMSGLDLLRNIAATDAPVVFVTGRSEVSCSVRAIKLGALDFMTIPFETAHLLEAIGDAIVHDCNTRARRAVELSLCERYASLTNRERQVLRLVVSGLRNKQSASELGISGFTLQIHRGQVMQKMQARSLADLVRMAEILKVPYYSSHALTEGQRILAVV